MSALLNNEFEQLNATTFASDKSKEIYSNYSLKGVEQILVNKYFIKKNAHLLDVGCGYGRTTVPLAEAGFQVVAIDVVERMIEGAKKIHPEIDYRLMSASSLNFPDQSFDYVLFSFNGLDYIFPDLRRHFAIQEMFRVLKPGGICILSSHNFLSLFFSINLFTVKVIIQNLLNLKIFSNYILARHREGNLLTYFKAPWRQIQLFEHFGFELIECRGKKYSDAWRVNLFEGWPYFVLRKM